MKPLSITQDAELIVQTLQQGELLAYPTEAVFGLGCDPDNEDAVLKLLALKKRPLDKGLILVAKTYSQLLPYVDDAKIPMYMRTEIFSSWPGPVTWLLPASKQCPKWVTGNSDLVAVRVSQHLVVSQLCELFGKPLISTSANVSGVEPAINTAQLYLQFDKSLLLVDGALGGANKPSQIRNGISGQTIRDN
ncbi:Sua5/YciO/YrdC/YwlC family protein [uncultured Paraglaciecola sp.]|uniref:Sua5/YciO/YrdC/YwlC family protein n=1 Tax=uncultured Paraglaciecola sp. TaxID=1765024 RepID=UPI0030DB2A88|tara:strand:- start:2644 stop:3216 length:573 start_codon:yes stop_codon:yes gene_type:complete